MAWIQPLEIETWVINVFAGSPDIFGAIAIMVIASLAGFFRMSAISMFFMLTIFFLMFSGYIGMNFLVLFGLIGGLLAGYWISKIVSR